MSNDRKLHEDFIQATDHYADTLRTWATVHLDWSQGNATIEEDRAADTARREALEGVQRLEKLIRAQSPVETQEPDDANEVTPPEPYDPDEIANELGHD